MAKKIYVGVSNKARKVKKIYVGVSNKARKVKKGYIGVGGKARLFYTAEPTLSKYGTKTLATARTDFAGTGIGSYVLFGGGSTNNSYTSSVETFNTSLTRSTASSLGGAVSSHAATSVGSYAIFAGGSDGYTTAYNTSLTRTYPSSIQNAGYRNKISGASVGSYALFAGGNGRYGWYDSVDYYDSSLTLGRATNLTTTASYMVGTSVGNYAVFSFYGDGYPSFAYNISLTLSTPTSVGYSCYSVNYCAFKVGTNGLFVGEGNKVSRYNSSLTLSKLADVGNYTTYRGEYSNPYGVCLCCSYGFSNATTAYVYNASLTRTTATGAGSYRGNYVAGAVGNYLLFAGGYTNSSPYYINTVDVYQVT